MRANCWMGRNTVQVQDVPDPKIVNQRDAVVKITSTAICGSDLHLYDGYIPTMEKGDILGHEFMGNVVEVGPAVTNLSVGDRVVVPFPIACGACNSCSAGMFGYSHLTGGFAGGQAEYVRVPFADVGPIKIESDLPDEKVLFLSDIFPTAYMGAEMCDIQPGDVVAVWGAGAVGLLAMACANLLGAAKIIAIDRFDYRLQMAREKAGALTINYEDDDVMTVLKDITAGRGPDACIDAVGMEAHSDFAPIQLYDRVKQAVRLETDRGAALRQAIIACRNGGTVSVIGVYGGLMDKFPVGSWMNRSITLKTGQTHVQRYSRPLLERIERGEIDPGFVITHRLPLEQAPEAYETFKRKQDECVKVVLSA